MKSLIKRAGLVVLCGVLIFFGAKLLFTQETKPIRPTRPPRTQDTTLRVGSDSLTAQETYVSEVILSAPWAKKNLVYSGEESPPGEFGLKTFIFPQDSLKEELPDPPLPEGPTSFTVAPNGNIYITDPLNERIQRFDANGNFVNVIPIPPLERGKYVPELSDSAKVEMLRQAGKLPKTHDQITKKPIDVQLMPTYQYVWSLICVDRHNNVYLLWWEDYTKQTLCKYDPAGKLLNTYPFFPEVRIGGGLNKLYCDHSDKLFFEYYRKPSDKEILSLKEWNLLKIPRMPFTFQIGTVDRVFNPEEQKVTLRKGVREILDFSKIKLEASKELPGKFLELSTIWNYDLIDEKGNFYRYCPTEEGVMITKWFKP